MRLRFSPRRGSAAVAYALFVPAAVAALVFASGCSSSNTDDAEPQKPVVPRDDAGCEIHTRVATDGGDVRLDFSDGFDRVENALIVLKTPGAAPQAPWSDRTNAEGSVQFKAKEHGGDVVPAHFDVLAYAPERDARTVFAFVAIGQRFQGLTLNLPRRKRLWAADVRTTVTGAPATVDTESFVDFLGSDGQHDIRADAATSGDPGASHVAWAGAYSGTADFTRLFVSRATDGTISGASGYATARVFLRGDDSPGVSMPFVAFAPGYTGGAVPLAYKLPIAGGFAPAAADVYLQMGDLSNAPLIEHRTAFHAEGDSVLVPNGPNTSLLILATATNGEASSTDIYFPLRVPTLGLDAGTPGPATFQFPSPPVLGPLTGDELTPGTQVSFAIPTNETDTSACMDGVGVYEVTFTPTDTTSPRVVVVTDQTTATLPDVTPFGLAIAPGAVYRVQVVRFPFFHVIDDLGYVFDRTRTRFSVSAPRTLRTLRTP